MGTQARLFDDGTVVDDGGDELAVAPPDFDLHFLALAQVKGVGPGALQALIDHYGDLGLVWDDDPTEVRGVLTRARVPGSAALADAIVARRRDLLAEAERDRDDLAHRGIRVMEARDPDFPERLRGLPDRPYWLFIEGNPAVLKTPSLVAVVGTRQPSSAGIEAAKQLTWAVANEGLGVVSGLAEGIDAAAHEIAARYDVPQVAVLGTGIRIVFPTSTSRLRRRIVESGGAVISEYLPTESYGRAKFVQRNRLQAGLAAAVCAVEGKTQSGTMHTIRFALKYERPIFGVKRGQPDSENEIPTLLADRGTPVFDVASDAGKQALSTFLKELPGGRFEFRRPTLDFLYRKVLKAWEDVISYGDATDEEKRQLVTRFSHDIGLPISEPERPDGG